MSRRPGSPDPVSGRPPAWRTVVGEVITVARKELLEFRRQPGVLVLVVLGPFLVLAAFGIGYRNEELSLRTVFVGPADSPYESAIERYTEAIDEYVVPVAFTTDLFAATEDLVADRADLIVVLPPEVARAVEAGRRSEIAVIHNSIDPIERIGIEFAAEVAVRELNATVVTSTLATLLDNLAEVDQTGGTLASHLLELETAVAAGDTAGAAVAVQRLRQAVDELEPALELSVGPQLGATTGPTDAGSDPAVDANGDGVSGTGSEALTALAERLSALPDSPSADEVAELRASVLAVDAAVQRLLGYDADLLARPFDGDAESLVRERVSPEDHVAPGATALLIQHLAVSLAALSLVRDERRGVMAAYRIGPTTVASVLLGKLIALSAVAGVAATLLVGLQVGVLGVPQRGSLIAIVGLLGGLVIASSALGLAIASVFRSELFASQGAMISLLVALFFSGFLLDLDRIIEPLRSLGLFVPATPAVEGLRVVQLRGLPVDASTMAILAIQAVVGLGGATALIAHRWRSGS